MRQNSFNSLIGVASNKGTVSLFTPNSQEPAIKLLAHSGTVNSFDFSKDGKYAVTVGSDSQMKVFDIRQNFQELYSYWLPRKPTDVRISQTGLVSIVVGNDVMFWKDIWSQKQKKPYLKHNSRLNHPIKNFNFVPYEDFGGLTSKNNFESILVPGSSIADYDTFEHDVSGNRKQAREADVHKLLDKLPPSSINWDPYLIGKIDPTSKEVKEKEKKEFNRQLIAKKYLNHKKKQKKKLKNNIRKNIYKDKLKREDVRVNNELRKKIYKAEKEKMQEELGQLNQNVDDIVDMTNKYITELKDE